MVYNSYKKKAEQSESEAQFEELKGPRKSPLKIIKAWRAAGANWGYTKELSRAEHAYNNALRYARRYLGEKEIEDLEGELLEIRKQNKRVSSFLTELKKGLEKKISYAFLSVTTLVLALVLISFNLTGNAIGGISPNDTRWIGACFFLFGLTFAFIYLKGKKKF